MLARLARYALTHRAQLAKFVVVGLLTFGINLSCFHLFYRAVGVDYRIAVSLAYVVTVVSHFLLNRAFTFDAAEQAIIHHAWRYALLLGINYIVSLGVVWITVEVAKITPYLGVVMSTAVTASISFVMLKHFVFREAAA